jgi:hypothetical protein
MKLSLSAPISLLLAAAASSVDGFSVPESSSSPPAAAAAASSGLNRRAVFTQAIAAAAALNTLSIASPPAPASAAVSGGQKVNAKLKAFGLPQTGPIPDGFSPLLEIYGKGKNRFPLLVTFSHPLTWVVTLPSNDKNGEDGTVQAGDYGKGDTATFYVYSDEGGVKDITTASRDLIETVLKRSIGQRGDNMYQNFKVTKLEPVTGGGSGSYLQGQSYVLADFKYQLLTGAGFEVDRRGVASITSEGPAVEVLWSASTAARFKKTEPTLRSIVQSFRCYADGINFADDLIAFEDS